MKSRSISSVSKGMLGVYAAVILTSIVPFMLRDSPFFLDVMIKIALYAFLGMAWNITAGYTGLIAFHHVALFGIGAYTSTLLQVLYGVNPWIGMLLGAFLSASIAAAFIYPAVKLKGLFLALATLAFATGLQVFLMNWSIVIETGAYPKYIGGAVGMFVPLTADSLVDFQWHYTKLPYCYIMLGLLFLQLLFVRKLMRSKIGYFLLSIREDEVAAAHAGIDVVKYKLVSMAIAGFFSAIAGTFMAQYILFVEPQSTMSLNFMFEVSLLTIMGGLGTLAGPLLGSLIYIPVSTVLRVLLGGTRFSGVALIILGVALIVMTIALPTGLYAQVTKIIHKWRIG